MLTALKTTAEDLQRQLSTGKIADTYSGQGAGRFRSLDLRAKLATYDGFSATIQDAELRLKMMDLSITRLQKSASESRVRPALHRQHLRCERQDDGPDRSRRSASPKPSTS